MYMIEGALKSLYVGIKFLFWNKLKDPDKKQQQQCPVFDPLISFSRMLKQLHSLQGHKLSEMIQLKQDLFQKQEDHYCPLLAD